MFTNLKKFYFDWFLIFCLTRVHQVTNVYTTALYWTLGSIYLLMNLTGFPKCMRQYKTQPGTNEPIDRKRLFGV